MNADEKSARLWRLKQITLERDAVGGWIANQACGGIRCVGTWMKEHELQHDAQNDQEKNASC